MNVVIESPEREFITKGASDAGFPSADALTLVAIFAQRRMEARGSSLREAVRLGGTVLCFIFDPVKSQDTTFTQAMRTARQFYRGISESKTGQADFAASLSSEFLMIDSLADALKLGAHALVRPQYQAGNT